MATFPAAVFQFIDKTQGWSEKYYFSSSVAPLSTVAAAAESLLVLRTKCFHPEVTIGWAYASYDDEFRDVETINVPIPPTPPAVWNSKLPKDESRPNACVVIRMSSGTRAGKMIFLSGIPDSPTYYPPLYLGGTVPGELGLAIKKFTVELRNGLWAWKGLVYDPAQAPVSPITSLTIGPDGWLATAANDAPYKVGDKVKLDKAQFKPAGKLRGNRVYRIIKKAGPVLTLAWGSADLSDNVYLGKGVIQKQVYGLWPFGADYQDKLGTHRRGGGWGTQRGRTKKRPSVLS